MSTKLRTGVPGTKRAKQFKPTNKAPGSDGLSAIAGKKAADEQRSADEANKPAQFIKDQRSRVAAARAKGPAWSQWANETERQIGNVERAQSELRKPPTNTQLRNSSPVYEGGNNSWIADVITLKNSQFGSAIPGRDGDIESAHRRLAYYGNQVRAHIMGLTEFGIRAAKAQELRYAREGMLPFEVERAMYSWRSRIIGMDYRDASTEAASLGSFVPPNYLLERFAVYRTNAAPLLAAASHTPLPPTGLVAYAPVIGSPIGITNQTGNENNSIVGTGFSASYASAGIETQATAVLTSQQLLDRVGPGVQIDDVIAKQAAIETASQFEASVATVIAAGAQTVTRNASATFSTASLWTDVANANQLAITAPGVNAHPTHLFAHGSMLNAFQSQLDESGRPVWAPDGDGIAGGNSGPNEAWSGYTILGNKCFYDQNLGGPSSGYGNVIVGAPDLGLLVFDSDPIIDVWPQYDPLKLGTIVTVRQYCAAIPLYPHAFVKLSGSFYSTTF